MKTKSNSIKIFASISSILIFSMVFSIPLSALAQNFTGGGGTSGGGGASGTWGDSNTTNNTAGNGNTNSGGTTNGGSTYQTGYNPNFNTDTSSFGQSASDQLSTSGGTNGSESQDTTAVQSQATSLQKSGSAAQGNNGTSNSNTYSSAGSSITSGAAQCSIGQIASQMIVSTVSKAIGTVKGMATNQVKDKVQEKTQGSQVSSVPASIVNDALTSIQNTDKAVSNQDKLAAQDSVIHNSSGSTVGSEGGFFNGIASFFDGVFQFPSLNAIGFCVVNSMIKYISDSTVKWIQSGFKGKPVFVSNTKQYFKGIADQEMGNFVNGLADGTLGINLCQPFKVAVLTDTLNGYSGRYNPLNCSLSQIKNNYKQFTGGQWNQGGFPGWFELIQQPNNIYGASLAAQDQARQIISTKQNTALIDLNWARGYRDFPVCADGGTVNSNGKCDNGQDTVKGTAGAYIENAVNSRFNLGTNRLNIATSFDQVVSALVNELIKIAVNKMFEDKSQ